MSGQELEVGDWVVKLEGERRTGEVRQIDERPTTRSVLVRWPNGEETWVAHHLVHRRGRTPPILEN